jgi:esterase/lipase superfamily enzyme
MKKLQLFYATNRNHLGGDRWHPKGYGTRFSEDGIENLRFGNLELTVEESLIEGYVGKTEGYGKGDGIGLSEELAGLVEEGTASITAYEEAIPDQCVREIDQKGIVLGSRAMFSDIREAMLTSTDVVVYIHGFNVSWSEAVGSALALQEMLNASDRKDGGQKVMVVLFTWPSDGMALPFVSYKSDRTEAKASGYAFGRALLKLRDFLHEVCKRNGNRCEQDIHLLCHSMGNYVLQSTLQRLCEFTPRTLPKLFEHIFMCAADVDDDALEDGKPLARLPEIAGSVSIYHNAEDKAMDVSDYTKGNPDRLGKNGAAHPTLLHNKINVVNCTPVVDDIGLVEHSYYLCGYVKDDIRISMDGLDHCDESLRLRDRSPRWPNLWALRKG